MKAATFDEEVLEQHPSAQEPPVALSSNCLTAPAGPAAPAAPADPARPVICNLLSAFDDPGDSDSDSNTNKVGGSNSGRGTHAEGEERCNRSAVSSEL